jgi:hypothetical protein
MIGVSRLPGKSQLEFTRETSAGFEYRSDHDVTGTVPA